MGAVFATLILFLIGAPAHAQARSIWSAWVDDNIGGASIVNLFARSHRRQFIYGAPDPGLTSVKPGDVLFDGSTEGNGYEGTAWIYPPGCEPVGYAVRGPISQHGTHVALYGKVPLVTPQCQIVGYRDIVLSFHYNNLNAPIPGPYD